MSTVGQGARQAWSELFLNVSDCVRRITQTKRVPEEPQMNFMQKVRRRLFPPTEVIEGYENPELVEAIFRKTVSFEPVGEWPLVAGVRTVLDFGGGAGVHYKVARRQSPDVLWAVVETPAM